MKKTGWFCVNCSRGCTFLLLLVLLIMLVPGVLPQAPIKAHPLIAKLAAEEPETVVSIIVQKTVKDNRVEEMVARLGGTVTKDLGIINAFAAKLKARDIPQLAKLGAVRWVSLDGQMESTSTPSAGATTTTNYFLDTLGVKSVWAMGLKGKGIGVAVIDSGISADNDFSTTPSAGQSRLVVTKSFNSQSTTVNDVYGHGTHVAGIIAGNGADSKGAFSGVAPEANLISLKISNERGIASESDVIAAMQWIFTNKALYNIRVLNLSLNTTLEQSYHTSPLNAAVEILWFNRVVVVASVGNKGPAGRYNTINVAPANDPFIIVVGASDEKGTASQNDDTLAPYSAIGKTKDGFFKPDIIAPGTSIVSVLSKNSTWGVQFPDRVAAGGEYFRLSGTSMAAPMVSGAVALLLQDEPHLTSAQVKYRLLNTYSRAIGAGDARRPYLNVYKAITGATTQSSGTGIALSRKVTASNQLKLPSVNWDSLNWDSLNWDSLNWDSLNWDSLNWDSLNWDGTYWGN